MREPDVLLEGRNLRVQYGSSRHRSQVRALDDVSVGLARSEILGVVGESGSGKSTLGKCLAGFIEPDSGVVIRNDPDDDNAGPLVQMVFQESATALDPRMPVWKSIGEALARGRRVGRSQHPAALSAMGDVGLAPTLATRLPSELSGGQRQRVAIARAVASGAKVIVCDEAVSALDASVAARVLALIMGLRRERSIAFLFISHDISVVGRIADRIAVMRAGTIVEEGPARQVILNPTHTYTRHLMAAVPRLQTQQLKAG